jgi:hypothetical protein
VTGKAKQHTSGLTYLSCWSSNVIMKWAED